MNIRRFLAVFLAVAAVLCTVSGCAESYKKDNVIISGNNEEKVQDETVITLFGYKADAPNLVAMEDALRGFMKENEGITVVYEGLKGLSYWAAFDKRSDTHNLNDVIMLNHDSALSLSEEGRLVDLSDLSTIENFNPFAKQQFIKEDGSVYFIPIAITCYGLYINYDVLSEHGLDIPTNLDEFADVCDYFVSIGITPIIANNMSSLKYFIMAKGMYPVYQSENPAEEINKFNSGEADVVETLRPGIELAQRCVESGWIDGKEALQTGATSDDLKIFAEGERPFMMTGGWASQRVGQMNTELNYGVYPFPILDDGSVLVMDINTCLGVNAEGGNVEASKKLVEYLTRPEVMWDYCDTQSSYTPALDSRAPSEKTIEPLAEYITNGRSVIGGDYNLMIPLDDSLTRIGQKLLGGASVEEAVSLLYELLEN